MAQNASIAGHVATIPALAAWDGPRLLRELETLAADENLRAVVLDFTGPVPEGVDPGSPEGLALAALPTVAAVSGALTGAAAEFVLAADIRIGEPTLELVFHSFGTRRQLQLLGRGRAIRLFEVGGRVNADLALELGLISEIAPAAGALKRAREVAQTIASRGPIATRLAKEAIWRGLAMPLEQALRFETDLTLLLQTTKDRAEGVSAFIEKRTPNFTGN